MALKRSDGVRNTSGQMIRLSKPLVVQSCTNFANSLWYFDFFLFLMSTIFTFAPERLIVIPLCTEKTVCMHNHSKCFGSSLNQEVALNCQRLLCLISTAWFSSTRLVLTQPTFGTRRYSPSRFSLQIVPLSAGRTLI